MCKELEGYTETVVISFLDEYQKLDKTKYRAPDEEEMPMIGRVFAESAKEYGLRIQTCAEHIDIGEYDTCLSSANIVMRITARRRLRGR